MMAPCVRVVVLGLALAAAGWLGDRQALNHGPSSKVVVLMEK